jgi:tetratricopeptide (TPR) repeat protein
VAEAAKQPGCVCFAGKKAINFKPDYYEAWYNKWLVLADIDRYSEAIEAHDKAKSLKNSG